MTKLDELPVLSLGDVGMTVKALQTLLRLHGFLVTVNGDFTLDTENKFKLFQEAAKLPVTGKTDLLSWIALLN